MTARLTGRAARAKVRAVRHRLEIAARLIVALAVAAAALPAAADAASRTYVMRSPSFVIGGFDTVLPKIPVPTPRRAGHITAFDAKLRYANGRQVSIRRVMLHHIVFINTGPGRTSSCPGRRGEPFWGTGEERQKLVLPPGYGYRVRAGDGWRMQTMLMSHSTATQVVHVEYRFKLVTGRRLTHVKPLWLRANGCRGNSYDVTGGQPEGAEHVRSHDWRVPFSGRIVAAGAHLHGSSKGMTITQPRCDDRTLVRHDPRYGNPSDLVYRLRPVLHEPGPIATGYFLSRSGIPVRRGDTLRVTGVYDAARPHPGVMAITHVYLARDAAADRGERCAPLPRDRRVHWERRDGRSRPPVVRLPLYGLDDRGKVVEIDRPPGREVVAGLRADVVARGVFQPANLSVALGAEVTWRFPERHNVLLAEGPRNVVSGTRTGGDTWTRRFDTPGEYRLFCWLHPVTMQQVLRVREGG